RHPGQREVATDLDRVLGDADVGGAAALAVTVTVFTSARAARAEDQRGDEDPGQADQARGSVASIHRGAPSVVVVVVGGVSMGVLSSRDAAARAAERCRRRRTTAWCTVPKRPAGARRITRTITRP